MNTRSRRDPAWLAFLDRVYGAAMRLYPRAHRQRWGEEMRQAFRAGCRDVTDRPRAVLHWCGMVVLPDLLASSLRERYTHLFQTLQGTAMRLTRTVLPAILLDLTGTVLLAFGAFAIGYGIVQGRFSHPGTLDSLTALQAATAIAGAALLAISLSQRSRR